MSATPPSCSVHSVTSVPSSLALNRPSDVGLGAITGADIESGGSRFAEVLVEGIDGDDRPGQVGEGGVRRAADDVRAFVDRRIVEDRVDVEAADVAVQHDVPIVDAQVPVAGRLEDEAGAALRGVDRLQKGVATVADLDHRIAVAVQIRDRAARDIRDRQLRRRRDLHGVQLGQRWRTKAAARGGAQQQVLAPVASAAPPSDSRMVPKSL